MNFCLKQSNSDLDKSYYVPGFQINYDSTSSLNSTESITKVIASTPYNYKSKMNKNVKSLSDAKDSAACVMKSEVLKTSSTRTSDTNMTKHTPTKSQNFSAKQNSVPLDVIADRCRVSFEGQGKFICVEGHGNVKLRGKKRS